LFMILIGAILWGIAWVLGVGRYQARVLVGFSLGVFGFLLLFGSLVFSLMIGIFDWGDAATGLVIGLLGALILYRYRDRLSKMGIGVPRVGSSYPGLPVASPAPVVPPILSGTAPPQRYCGACGARNSGAARFCGGCGRPLLDTTGPS